MEPARGGAGRERRKGERKQDKTKNKLKEVHREVGNGKNTRGQDKTEGWEIGSSGTKKEKSEEKEGRGEEGEPEEEGGRGGEGGGRGEGGRALSADFCHSRGVHTDQNVHANVRGQNAPN